MTVFDDVLDAVSMEWFGMMIVHMWHVIAPYLHLPILRDLRIRISCVAYFPLSAVKRDTLNKLRQTAR